VAQLSFTRRMPPGSSRCLTSSPALGWSRRAWARGSCRTRLGLTYLVIAHDLAVVHHVSDEVGVMYLGSIVEQAPSDALYRQPVHPYTISLMSAVPVPDPVVEDYRERILLTGDLPSLANPPDGCRFHTRCPFRQPTRCDDERPALREIRPGHKATCHYAEEILSGQITPTEAALRAGQGPLNVTFW